MVMTGMIDLASLNGTGLCVIPNNWTRGVLGGRDVFVITSNWSTYALFDENKNSDVAGWQLAAGGLAFIITLVALARLSLYLDDKIFGIKKPVEGMPFTLTIGALTAVVVVNIYSYL